MNDTEVDAWIEGRLKMLQHHARGCGFEAIQAQVKLKKLTELSPEQKREAARQAVAEGL